MMTSCVSAHYLAIEWHEPRVARRIDVSQSPIEIETEETGRMRAETLVFRDFHPWVGLQLSGRFTDAQPHTLNANGTRLPWLRLHDDAGRDWWVFETGWNSDRNAHFSAMHRSIAHFEVALGDERLIFDNIALELNRAQAEEYLEQFRDELIWLAVGRANGATGWAVASERSDLLDSLEEFADVARRILDHPGHEMHEIVAPGPSSRIRPNGATFRAAIRRPGMRLYPGRSAYDSADIPDNRYLRHMLQVCSLLAWQIAQASERHERELIKVAEREESRGGELQATDYMLVDPEVFENQLADLKAKVLAIETWRDPDVSEEVETREYRLRVGAQFGSSNAMFCNNKEGGPLRNLEDGTAYYVFSLPQALFDLVKAVRILDEGLFLIVQGTAVIGIRSDSSGKQYRKATFGNIRSVLPHSPAILRREELRGRLSRDGWRQSLSASDREEYREEARVARKRAERKRAHAGRLKGALTRLHSLHAYFSRQDENWSALGVSTSPLFPMGMRFVQNPRYASALSAFRKIRHAAEQSGIGDTAIHSLKQIDILHASALFERWCLVKIIAVLVEDFAFTPPHDWIDSVITGVSGRKKAFTLHFQHNTPAISARLEVQPTLANGRRPDFRLQFYYRKGDTSRGEAATARDIVSPTASLRRKEEHERSRGLILDAKFRTRWSPGELPRMVEDLLQKGYQQERNKVFVLQPSPITQKRRTSPLMWGQTCDYGQDSPTFHATGAIQISSDAITTDNLRRLIALELQSGLARPEWDEENNACVSVSSICVRCGKEHKRSHVEQKRTRGGHPKWQFRCEDCGGKTIRTHCYGCGTPLFKNGVDLTYHLTMPEQIFNIACAQCGKYFDNLYDWGEQR